MQYLIHVIDQSGQYSFCRSQIIGESCIQLNLQDQVLMWVGQQKADGTVPAWVFYMVNQHDLQPMQGVITKALMEMNFQRELENAGKSKKSTSSSQKTDSDDMAENL